MESDIYKETAIRLWDITNLFIEKKLEDPKVLQEEISRIEQLPLTNDILGKQREELSGSQYRFAQMLYFAKLARKDSKKAIEFAKKQGII